MKKGIETVVFQRWMWSQGGLHTIRSREIHLKVSPGCERGDQMWDGSSSSQSEDANWEVWCPGAARESRLDAEGLLGPSQRWSLCRFLVQETGETDQETEPECTVGSGRLLDAGSLWIFFSPSVGYVQDGWKEEMFFLLLFAPWPHTPFSRTQNSDN